MGNLHHGLGTVLTLHKQVALEMHTQSSYMQIASSRFSCDAFGKLQVTAGGSRLKNPPSHGEKTAGMRKTDDPGSLSRLADKEV